MKLAVGVLFTDEEDAYVPQTSRELRRIDRVASSSIGDAVEDRYDGRAASRGVSDLQLFGSGGKRTLARCSAGQQAGEQRREEYPNAEGSAPGRSRSDQKLYRSVRPKVLRRGCDTL